MNTSILMLTGSPIRDGNTAALGEWFVAGARVGGAVVEIVNAAKIESKVNGCQSCRACQKRTEYGCVFNDGVKGALDKMIAADAIVMATPMYFFSASAQIKALLDRMFSLYKWDNEKGTMQTPLKGKLFALVASAHDVGGFDALEAPFRMTAEYTGMKYLSLLVPNAGVSGEVRKQPGAREKAEAFGRTVADMITHSNH